MTGDESQTGQLSGSFGAGATEVAAFAKMTHPYADEILEKCEGILEQIPKGQELLEAKKRYNIPVTVITGKETIYTTPDDEYILLMAHNHKNEFELTACVYGMALRDAEQSFAGFKRPSRDIDPAEYASMTFSKSLDIIMHLCIIADELKEKLGYTKPLDLIEHLGHGYIYRAYKKNLPHDEIIDLFIEGETRALEQEGKQGE